MTADTLRRAASLMRERANAATPGPWTTPDPGDEYVGPWDVVDDGVPGDRYVICEHAGQDAQHIASWHPAVALAVADLLDRQADFIERGGDFSDIEAGGDASCLAVARAYLGEDA